MYSPSTISSLPQSPGVYRYFDNAGKLLYIGKAIDLKKRVSSYFQKKDLDQKTAVLVNLIYSIDIAVVRTEFEALLLESQLIRKYKPKYNVIWRDDKHFIYIKITKEKYPRILYSRKDDDSKAVFYGPFPSFSIVKTVLSYLRHIYPYCGQNRNLKRPCFYTHLGLCNPCPAFIETLSGEDQKKAIRKYTSNISHIKKILNGNIKEESHHLETEMKKYSKNEEYENAALYRDRLMHLQYLTQNFHPLENLIEQPFYTKMEWEKEQKELLAHLKLFFPDLAVLSRIECYDISNISGKFASGSMVTFINGVPEKKYYRKFKIRLIDTPNDFTMHKEMMHRRLKHTEWQLPDLFVIDGGKPQLRALAPVFDYFGMKTPVIGIAKEDEELVIPSGKIFEKLKLKRDSSALHLIQRLRNEAHRFAKKYHTLLRVQSLFGANTKSASYI